MQVGAPNNGKTHRIAEVKVYIHQLTKVGGSFTVLLGWYGRLSWAFGYY